MTLKVQGKWEAKRIADALERMGRLDAKSKPWADECAHRIRHQVQDAERREDERQMVLM